MAGVSAIEVWSVKYSPGPCECRLMNIFRSQISQPDWLEQCGTPLARVSEPLSDPAPLYRPPPEDVVVAAHDVAYGRPGWPVPRYERQLSIR